MAFSALMKPSLLFVCTWHAHDRHMTGTWHAHGMKCVRLHMTLPALPDLDGRSITTKADYILKNGIKMVFGHQCSSETFTILCRHMMGNAPSLTWLHQYVLTNLDGRLNKPQRLIIYIKKWNKKLSVAIGALVKLSLFCACMWHDYTSVSWWLIDD